MTEEVKQKNKDMENKEVGMAKKEEDQKQKDTKQEPDNSKKDVSVEELKKQLAQKEQELNEMKEKVLRLAAELENFKKRIQKEKEDHMRYALETFARELLPFLDNLERAISAAKETKDIDKLLEGLDLTLSGYFKTLEKFGLKPFVALGERFDPNIHEALGVEENEEVDENTVVKELLKGYKLHDRVLRPAMVVVSKKPNNSSNGGSSSN